MAHKVIDRCKETTSTTGTGTLTLTGAVSGFVAMANATAGLTADGDTGWFCAENGAEWEVFLGTRVDATHLARTTVISSSNAGAAVNFTSAPVVFSTVPAAKLSAVGPAFSAYRSGNQTGITNNTYVKVQLNAEEFDTNGCFDSTTNYRFTPTVEGYYHFEWAVDGRGTTLTVGHSKLYKNGAEHKSGGWAASSSAVSLSGGAATVYMNGSTDYVELFGYTSAASGNLFNAGSVATYLSGHFVRGA